MNITRARAPILGVGVVVFALLPAACASTDAKKPGVVVAEMTELRAKVDAVDYAKRVVTVTGPQGNTVAIKAGPQVRNLEQIKVGDQVVVRHYESVALFVRKSSEPPGAVAAGAVEVAAKGEKPAGAMADTVEVTAKVEAVDQAARTVTLKGPAGNVRTFKVDPSVERLKDVKVGDDVVLRYTEALAIAVVKP
jgi:hypothetical protein